MPIAAAVLTAVTVVTLSTTSPVLARPAQASAQGRPTTAYPSFGLAETSGLAVSVVHPGLVWVVEDSGDPVTRAYDVAGDLVASVTLAGWNNRDTEALTMGPGPTLWVADIGDNLAVRESVVVHTFEEPAELGPITLEPVSYRLRYPNGPRDAEAAMVDPISGQLFVASKSIFGPGGLYAAPTTLTPGATHDLVRVASVPSLVVDGTFTPDGGRLVLRTLTGLDLGTAAHIFRVQRDAAGRIDTLIEIDDLSLPAQTQGEAVAVTTDGRALLLASEGAEDAILAVRLPADDDAPSGATPTGPSAEEPAAGPGPATAEDGTDACRLADPIGCLDRPVGWLTAIAIGLVVALVAARALLRRAGGGR